MNILGIETSCDETAAAVVKDGNLVLSNVVYTQIPLHKPYGGVVPEIASRAHIEKISEVVRTALADFNASYPDEDIDAVAVTYGPGLSPALIVGVNAAKGIALSLGKDLIAINHIEAHLHTPFLRDSLEEPELCPDKLGAALGLAVSGGHTAWIDMDGIGKYRIIGQTLDDAAGEAFDKAAKLLGLGYPGGPKIDKISKEFFAAAPRGEKLFPFPKGHPREGVSSLSGLPADLCVSFSGLKTALLRFVEKNGGAEKIADDGLMPKVVASYQEAIVSVIADRTSKALGRKKYSALIVGGGVSLNSRLRAALTDVAAKHGVSLLTAKPKYCGDNAAMIAALAYYRQNIAGDDAMNIDVCPSLEIGS